MTGKSSKAASINGSQSGGSASGIKASPGRTRRNSTERRRRRRERFFRFLLRRKPCYVIFFSQFAAILVLYIIFSFLSAQLSSNKKAVLQKHEDIHQSKKEKRTLLHCNYQHKNDFDASQFKMNECRYRCGSDAYIYREVPLVGNRTDLCADKIELFPCSEQGCIATDKTWKPSPLIETACLGKNHGYMRRQHVAPVTPIMAPKLELTEENKGRLIYATELIAECPRCRVKTHWMKKHKLIRCERNLETLREGWPWDYRFCNYVERGSCEEIKLNLNEHGEDNY
uniref:Uncharacterized protein n=1 Tax=Steinernema glaseri TaxID=37863 RepID=A0A1I7YVM1_9BILA